MAKSDNLRKAKEEKNDEFYTQLDDIIAEIAQHPDYVKYFEGKIVFMNCDDPEWSSFVEFFRKFFKKLKLKKIISTHYNKDGSPSYKLEWNGEKINGDTVNMIKTPLYGNGDFRSQECIDLLKEADIVVTNPPFSLFKEFIEILVENKKDFIVIGNKNAIAYKEVFPLLQNGKMFLGYNKGHGTMYFSTKIEDINVEKNFLKSVPAYWYTSLKLDKSDEELILTKNYKGNEDKYPKYYNYNAIDVNSLRDIPKDYYGYIGVPITFMANYCPNQFKIIGMGTEVEKNKDHISHKAEGIINYEKNGVVFWSTVYTVNERKIGNSLRIERNGLPYKTPPYNRIIIQRIKKGEI